MGPLTDYLGSLRDMQAYIMSVKALLKTREQKQLDFEGLTDYLTKAASDRDQLASQHGSSGLGASGFIRSRLEDVRGVDHEQARRDRVRRLELQIERLTTEVESAKKTSEAFDEETIKEVADFERIKAVEFRDSLGSLAESHIDFYQGVLSTWERFIAEMEEPRDFWKSVTAVTIAEVILFSLVGSIIYAYTGSQSGYMKSPAFGSISNEVYKKVSFSFMIPTLIFLGVLYASVSARFIFFNVFEGSRHKTQNTVVGWASWGLFRPLPLLQCQPPKVPPPQSINEELLLTHLHHASPTA